MRIDLHTHSDRSDGTDTPAELVRHARDCGIDVLALTDHDTTEGWDEAADVAERLGVTLVRGIEISARHDGDSVHLLAYLPDPTYAPLAEELRRINEGRTGRIPQMVANLRAAGYELSEDEVRGAAEAREPRFGIPPRPGGERFQL